MESYGNVFDEEWVNLTSMFSFEQNSDHLTGHGLFSSDQHDHSMSLDTSILWPNANDFNSSSSSDHDITFNFDNYFSQESSNDATNSPPSYPCHHMMEGDSSNFLLLTQVFSDEAMEEILCLKQDELVVDNSVAPIGNKETTLLKRKYEMLEEHPITLEQDYPEKLIDDDQNVNPKKKTRGSRNVDKNKKNSVPKKKQKIMKEDGKESDENNNGRSSSSCSSEEDCQDLDGGATEKTRAGRGAATDPQSIYARKRRERINERLRILQNLVPNGTKVDISTMLEEAVHYVKYLQLQIKLLSSDDKWMYAPIAYNGMDMGLYNSISQTL